jgi:AAA15 family ATPase/GTPase
MNIKEINITSFRGLKEISLVELGTLNIITGDNSSGKTAVLEAIFMAFGLNPQTFQDFPAKFRKQSGRANNKGPFWEWLFPEKNLQNDVIFEITTMDESSYSVRSIHPQNVGPATILFEYSSGNQIIRFGPTGGSFPAGWPIVSSPDLHEINYVENADKYNRVVSTSGGEERLLALIQALDKRVKKIRYLKLMQDPLVYVDIGLENLVPVSQMGEAFSRVFSLYLEMIICNADILILDEIESGIHVDKMDIVWQGLAALSKQEEIQIITTTHSRECLRSAFAAVGGDESINARRYDLKLGSSGVVVHASDSLVGT